MAAKSSSTRHPLFGPMLAAGLARCVSAYAAAGFYGRDDEAHVLQLIAAWPSLLQVEPVLLLQLLGMALGAFSLVSVAALFVAAKRSFDLPTARLAAYLAALHPAMPFAATHLWNEGVALPFLCLALAALAEGPRRDAPGLTVLGGIALGVACGLSPDYAFVAVGLCAGLAWQWRQLARAAVCAAITFVVALGISGAGGEHIAESPGASLSAWFVVGMAHSSIAHSLAWWLLLSVPPATLWLVPAMARVGRNARPLQAALASYVVAQLLLMRPEPRFLVPALPLVIVLMAAAPRLFADLSVRLPARRLWPAARRYSVAFWALGLILLCTYQGQTAVRTSLMLLRADTKTRGVISLGPPLDDFYLQGVDWPRRRRSVPDAGWLLETLGDMHADGIVVNRYVAFAADEARVNLLLGLQGIRCGAAQRFESNPLDRWLFTQDPVRHRRRDGVVLWRCDTQEVARSPLTPPRRTTADPYRRQFATGMRRTPNA